MFYVEIANDDYSVILISPFYRAHLAVINYKIIR